MSKFIFGIMLSSALLLGASAPASAGTPRINHRERHQQNRIRQGVRSGELSARETWRLEAEQARIRALEARAKANGYVSPYERARINRELNQANRHIRRQKHD